jgi:hypothetical protein
MECVFVKLLLVRRKHKEKLDRLYGNDKLNRRDNLHECIIHAYFVVEH